MDQSLAHIVWDPGDAQVVQRVFGGVNDIHLVEIRGESPKPLECLLKILDVLGFELERDPHVAIDPWLSGAGSVSARNA
jgi:hypothetical protein